MQVHSRQAKYVICVSQKILTLLANLFFIVRMKTKNAALTFALTMTAALCWASPEMGTWKLDESKSKLGAGMGKNSTVVYQAVGDQIKVTVDGVDSKGQPIHNEWTGKFDGKDYPVTGDANSDTRAYTKVNENTLTMVSKKDGKTTSTGKVVVTADGKTRTVTISGTSASGEKFEGTAVYNKE